MLSATEKRELITLEYERIRRVERRRLFSFTPYPKQLDFYADGKVYDERLFMAGNQLGKTLSGAFEAAMHLTGRYPEPGQIFYPSQEELRAIARTAEPDSLEYTQAVGMLENLGSRGLFGADVYPNGWPGRRFNRPISAWVGGKSSRDTRDIVQAELIGDPENPDKIGTGAIPYDDLVIESLTRLPGVSNAYDTAMVRHVSGGMSRLGFKSFDQGRERWQGTAKDLVWFDEEPPFSVYMEGRTRTNARNGITFLTFTPLLGMSTVVRRFIHDENVLRIK